MDPSLLIYLPVIIPLTVGVTHLFIQRQVRLQRTFSLAGGGFQLLVSILILQQVQRSGVLTASAGSWPAPYGIVFAIDTLSSLMLITSSLLSVLVMFFAIRSLDESRERYFFHPMYQFIFVGVNGAFITGDLFNLFVFFEILLFSSYFLLVLGGEAQQLQEGFKYMILNFVASTLFLTAIATTYAMFGTVNMADLAVKVAEAPANAMGLITGLSFLWFVVFGMKAAVFPLYFWLPGPYSSAPTVITALFSGLLTKVGVYAIFRLFTLIIPLTLIPVRPVLLVLSGLTMLLGVLGAISKFDIKQMLSFDLISQIGFMLMGLAIFTPLGIAAGLFHTIHNMIIKTTLFLTTSTTEQITQTTDLRQLGGLMKSHPGLAGVFLASGLSLAGIPPFSGFFSKLGLVISGLADHRYLIVAISLLVSFLTMYVVLKIFRSAYWGEMRKNWRQSPLKRSDELILLSVPLIMISLSLFAGFGSGPIYGIMMQAAHELLNPQVYINAVLPTAP